MYGTYVVKLNILVLLRICLLWYIHLMSFVISYFGRTYTETCYTFIEGLDAGIVATYITNVSDMSWTISKLFTNNGIISVHVKK